MASLHFQLEELKSSWKTWKAQDDGRYKLVESLFTCIGDLSRQLSDAQSDLRDKKDLLNLERGRLDHATRQLENVQHEKAAYMFASVLIDGDCMLFKDDLVKQGLDGGQKTANLLRQAVYEDLKATLGSEASHMRVLVRVYANLKGLAKTYKDHDFLSDPATLYEFVRGFNMGNDLCDFVDAGSGKECADEKIKANFRTNLTDIHCQQIYFGGAPDNGYARLLGPYREDKKACRRVTLLEGPPFANELANLRDSFRITSLDNFFRNEKLPALKGRVSSSPLSPSSVPTNYATAAAIARLPTVQTLQMPSSAAKSSPLFGVAHYNKLGQRVDVPLPQYSSEDFYDLKSRRLCNAFHLVRSCPYQEKYGKCNHDHDGKLSDKQLVALAAVARLSPCSMGLTCSNPYCYSGHRCTRADCHGSTCWFSDELHGIDAKIVES